MGGKRLVGVVTAIAGIVSTMLTVVAGPVSAAPRAFRAGEVRTIAVAGQAGVPASGVGAVLVNLTATSVTAPTFVTAWPSGQARPDTSNLNPVPGQDTANLAVVPVDATGAISLYNHAGSAELVVDVVGYIPASSGFTPASTRLVDTRTAATPLVADAPRTVPLGLASPRVAVVNLTGVGATAPTFLTAWTTGATRPATSNLNLATGVAAANLAVVTPGADGTITVANHAGRVDLVVDLLGSFPADATITALAPTRLLDTRDGAGPVTPDDPGAIAATVVRSATGTDQAGTMLATLTGVNATARAFATVWTGPGTRPATSNLNLRTTGAVANLMVLPVTAGGDVHLYLNAGRADLVVDAVAWVPGDGAVVAVAPARLYDTRTADAGDVMPPVTRTFTYSVAARGAFTSDMTQFAASAAATLADPRGWRAAGIGFQRVDSGGDFTLWLSEAAFVPSFGPPCTVNYSCRVGRNVIINEFRWRTSSPVWVTGGKSIDEYQDLVVNHEVGHFLGFDHVGCSGPGQLAAVMQQQSKGLDGCLPNEWPLAREISALTR